MAAPSRIDISTVTVSAPAHPAVTISLPSFMLAEAQNGNEAQQRNVATAYCESVRVIGFKPVPKRLSYGDLKIVQKPSPASGGRRRSRA